MKAHLMHASRDVDLEQPLPPNAAALLQDLELDTVLDAMAGGDGYLRERAQATLLTGLDDPQAIRYRQRILADFLEQPTLARELYDLAGEALESKRNAHFFWFRDSPDALLQKSIAVLELLAGTLGRLRRLAEEHGEAVASEGLQRLFATVRRELDDDYLATLDRHLHDLRFRKGALISAELGRGNRGTNYVLRQANGQSLMERMTPLGPRSYSFTIPARDEHGHEALAALRNRGIRLAAAAVAQSADHVLGFLTTLRAEVAFYVGCLNLHERLGEKELPACFPEPLEPATAGYGACGLYDVSLSFHLEHRAIGNDVDGDGVSLVVITGPNQGGKSTFLRSVGVAQLLLQAGSFVPAESFRASVRRGVFTHFKREEDAGMTSGKLDEELSRMSAIAEHIDPGDLLLCNESFSSTNEQEGSEIGRGLVRALTDAGVQVWLVTHLYDLAQSLYRAESPAMSFLRAERRPDGTRTFRMLPGEPLPTSHGEDSYRRIFGAHGGDTASVAETA